MRVRAFEAYLQGHQNQGRKPSLRAIAMALGVTEAAVRYWCHKDKWDIKLDALLNEKAVAASKGSQAVANLLRSHLYENLNTLNRIIRNDTEKPLIRIRAISEFADICIKLKVIEPGDFEQKPAAPLAGFKDDLDGTPPSELHDAAGSTATVADNHDDVAPDPAITECGPVGDISAPTSEPAPSGGTDDLSAGANDGEYAGSGADAEPGRDEQATV